VLMDEPFSALDPLIRVRLQDELLALHAEVGKTIVFITHDLDEALRLGTRVAVLDEGRVVQVGTPAQLLREPAGAHVAAFVRDVNRARAWRIADATRPWPAALALPALADAVDESATLEQAMARLVGRGTPLAVRRGERIVGEVDVEVVRALLDARR
jgi:glycine betaine/proline transport system ATP-binding protein